MSIEKQPERDQEQDTNPSTLGDLLASVVARVDAVGIAAEEAAAPTEPTSESGTQAVAERVAGVEGKEDRESKR